MGGSTLINKSLDVNLSKMPRHMIREESMASKDPKTREAVLHRMKENEVIVDAKHRVATRKVLRAQMSMKLDEETGSSIAETFTNKLAEFKNKNRRYTGKEHQKVTSLSTINPLTGIDYQA